MLRKLSERRQLSRLSKLCRQGQGPAWRNSRILPSGTEALCLSELGAGTSSCTCQTVSGTHAAPGRLSHQDRLTPAPSPGDLEQVHHTQQKAEHCTGPGRSTLHLCGSTADGVPMGQEGHMCRWAASSPPMRGETGKPRTPRTCGQAAAPRPEPQGSHHRSRVFWGLPPSSACRGPDATQCPRASNWA